MLKNLINSIGAYGKALKLINQLRLWKYFLIPMLISLLTAIIIGLTAYGLYDDLGIYLSDFYPFDWGKEAFSVISNIIAAIIILAIGIILYKHIILAFSAPFMSPVSEKIELHLTGKTKTSDHSFSTLLWRSIRLNSRNIVRELLITIPILLLKFIPVVNIFSTITLFLLQAYYVGFSNMDFTLERYFKYSDSIKFVKKHKSIAIGNGIIFLLILFIPVIGIILVLPLSVTAASIKTVAMLDQTNHLAKNENPI